jgi:hypothetical protein
MYKANVYRVMIASPGDVKVEREIARELIYEWNTHHSSHRNIVLIPLLWEYNITPTTGQRPQETINDQILRHADLVIGIFWTRIGSSTGRAISGTVEEIETHVNAQKPAMLYFSNAPIPQGNFDPQQFEAVQKFKKEYQQGSLYWLYSSTDDFRDLFRSHLTMKMNEPELFKGYEEKLVQSDRATIIPLQQDPFFSISQEAKELLKEDALDGEIMSLGYLGGKSIQTNGKNYTGSADRRERAKWEGAVDELEENGYIKAKGSKREIFAVTSKGYNAAKFLEES